MICKHIMYIHKSKWSNSSISNYSSISQQSQMVPSIDVYHKQFNQKSVICLHIAKWLNSCISNNSIWHIFCLNSV